MPSTAMLMTARSTYSFSAKALLDYLKDIKAWLALNFLNFNEKKTEVIVFGPSGPCKSTPADLGPLETHFRPIITNLGFRIDSDFELEGQIRSVVKSCFYHLISDYRVLSAY